LIAPSGLRSRAPGRRHLAQRRQAVALLHLLVQPAVLDGDRGLVADLQHRGELVGGERFRHPVVQHAEETHHALGSDQRNGDPGAHRRHRRPDLGEAVALLGQGGGLGLRLRHELAQLGEAPLDQLHELRLLPACALCTRARRVAASMYGVGAGPR